MACSTTQIVSSDHPLTTNTRSIAVHLLDGRLIKFLPEDYTIAEDSDSSYIHGKGRQTSGSEVGEKVFRGSINRSEIKEIQVVEPALMSTIVFPLTIGIIGLMIGLIIMVNNNPPEMGG
jgi:hypothetical protein